MKKIFYAVCILLIVFGLIASAYANSKSFFDNFNYGWTLDPSSYFPAGTWSFVDGTLFQSGHGDWYTAVVNNLTLSDQRLETDVKPRGYGGFIFWFQDNRDVNPNDIHFVAVVLYIWDPTGSNPYSGLRILEVENAVETYSVFDYPTTSHWYDLKVHADSNRGIITILVNGKKVLTYYTRLPKEDRIGQSGITSGNDGAYFDNFCVRGLGK